MERDWLAERLEDGASIEAIAREVGRDPSSVSYWVRKHGLTSSHAERHAARGPIERELLTEIVACGLSVRDMAHVFERSPASIRHWLRKHGLETTRASRLRLSRTALPSDAGPDLRMCPNHGPTPSCSIEMVIHDAPVPRRGGDAAAGSRAFDAHRRSWRRLRHLRFRGAHRRIAVPPRRSQPESFTIRNGDTRSLERMRHEASKCVLLCANCHAQVEAGTADLPVRSNANGPRPG